MTYRTCLDGLYDFCGRCQLRSGEVMGENLGGTVTLLAHHGCSYLAEADTVSPAGSMEYYPRRIPVGIKAVITHRESRTVEMAL